MKLDREGQLQTLREIREASEQVLQAAAPGAEFPPSDGQLLEAFRTIDLLCRARLPGRYRHKVVHRARQRAPGQGPQVYCGAWVSPAFETTADPAAVTCKACRRSR